MTALGIGLGVELKDSGIRVTNVYPGEVDTPIMVPSPGLDVHLDAYEVKDTKFSVDRGFFEAPFALSPA